MQHSVTFSRTFTAGALVGITVPEALTFPDLETAEAYKASIEGKVTKTYRLHSAVVFCGPSIEALTLAEKRRRGLPACACKGVRPMPTWTTTTRDDAAFAPLFAALTEGLDEVECGECGEPLALREVAAIETSQNAVTNRPYSLPLCAPCAKEAR